ncbi:TOTE conflict system archaeo-eukaryotic primase domain-containing protein [Clostridium perfringens]|uniref:TOTE conflict system archaeo-eukaryotic primase domain-containing protein n=1 Tax=Clostridium perfringens TaxID=1502 RepID=UPI0039EB48D6
MKNKELVKCPYCGKEYKAITKGHLKKHNVTYEEYLREYKPVNYMEKLIIKFFREYYISVTYKYLNYPQDGKTYTVNSHQEIKKIDSETGEVTVYKPLRLVDKQLQEHLRCKNTIGIFFPTMGTKLVGFDIDIKDEEALNKVYTALIRFVEPTDVFLSSSGGKGYHIDLFLDRMLDRDIVKRFYQLILDETGLNNKEVELRGASDQGWKLPLGMHFKKGAYCGAVNEFGKAIDVKDLEELIKSRTKADSNKIIDAVLIGDESEDINITSDSINYLDDEEIIEFEEITGAVTKLDNYSNLHQDFINDLTMIYAKGFEGEGLRNKYTFKIALFLKSHMKLSKKDTLQEMTSWMDRCKGYRATKKEFEKDIKATVDKIFKEDLKLVIAANEIKISKVEIKEILSIKCRTSQETRALRCLYYMMFLHSKAYADTDGVFFMTLEQMQEMGAAKTKRDLLKQINKLIDFNKVYKYPTKRISKIKYAPTEYKLIALSQVTVKLGCKVFSLCDDVTRCIDCIDRATDFLITTRSERQQYRKGKCLECPYNKR